MIVRKFLDVFKFEVIKVFFVIVCSVPAHSVFYYQHNTLTPTHFQQFPLTFPRYPQNNFLPTTHQHHYSSSEQHKHLFSPSPNLFHRPPHAHYQQPFTAPTFQHHPASSTRKQQLGSPPSFFSRDSYQSLSSSPALFQQPPSLPLHRPYAPPRSLPHRQRFMSPPPQFQHPQLLQRQVRQSPHYLNTHRYVAVPGRIVQQINYTTTLPISTPAIRTRPIVASILQPSYYESESDPSSSNPDQNNESNEEDGSNGGTMEPPPPESGPEEPPPMMSTMSPPPPENENNTPPDSDPPPPPGKVIHKHVSIHAPPDDFESEDDQVTVIRPKIPGPQKHVNIIFVKAPSMRPRKQKTEVILPEVPEQKTLVYVLVKRPDPAKDGSIRVRGPAPTKPSKPQVFFIRYKQHKNKGDNDSYVYSESKPGYHR